MNLDWTTDLEDATSQITSSVTTTNNDEMNMQEYERVTHSLAQKYGKKNCTYAELEDMAEKALGALPTLNVYAIQQEVSGMGTTMYPNPSTSQLLESLQELQEYRNRLAEIINIVEHEHSVRKWAVDMLSDANQAISKMSSADKRKGETKMRYPIMFLQYDNVCNLRLFLSNAMTNLQKQSEAISRQITVIGQQMSLGEYRKKVSSDFVAFENFGVDYKTGATQLSD